jgi:WD40 repeat protein
VSESTSRNPYVGPYSLRYGERIYGRDREARQLLELLIAERIVLLYSPSGAGKTSLIQAALIPMLKSEEFHVLPAIRVNAEADADPRNRYVMSALLSLEQEIPLQQTVPPKELALMQFADYLTRRESASSTADRTFLIFDQFEEVLTIDPLNRDAKVEFFNQVGNALRDLKRWALFAMREDHVAALDPYLRPIPTRLKATFRLDLLTEESARLAVQGPAKECGVMFTEAATTKLVDDLRQVAVQGPTGETVRQLGPYVEPVQLQVVCHRLWEKLGTNVQAITEEEIAGTGNVDSALADYYADKVAHIAAKSGVKERVLREWFDRCLITESGLRSQVMVGSENTKELNTEAIKLLEDVHLIREENRRGVTWLELAHDRLVNPIRTDNAAWALPNLSVLQHQAAVWQSRGRNDALCLRGVALTEALGWSAAHAAEMTQTEKEFLEVCKRNRNARQGKRLRWAVVALGVVLGIITLLALLAWNQSQIATAQRIAARAYQLLDERLDTALLLAIEAHRRSDQPDTFGTLVTAAYYNPRLTTYLGISPKPNLNVLPPPINAVAFNNNGKRVATGDFAGRVVLWDVETYQQSEDLGPLVAGGGAVRAIAFSPDGRYLAVGGDDNTIQLRDLEKGENKTLQQHPEDKKVFSLAFSSDSNLLASGDSAGNIVIRSLATDVTAQSAVTLDTTCSGEKPWIRGLSFGKDAEFLVAGCDDGQILIWYAQADQWVRRYDLEFDDQNPKGSEVDPGRSTGDSQRKDLHCLMVSADGKYLAGGRNSGAVDLYDLSAYDLSVARANSSQAARKNSEPQYKKRMLNVTAFGRHDGLVNSLAFSADSKFLITAGADGTLRLWQVPSMKSVGRPLTGHVGRVFGVAFSVDNRTVASGGEDRCAILWDTSLRVEQVRNETTNAAFGMAFSPDGTYEADSYAGGAVFLKKLDYTGGEDPSQKELIQPSGDDKFLPIVTFSRNGHSLASNTADGKVYVYDLTNAGSGPHQPIPIDAVANNERKKITAIALNKDGSFVAVTLSGKHLKPQVLIWRVTTQEPLMGGPLECAEGEKCAEGELFYAVEFSPDSNRIATGGVGQFVSIWSLAGGSNQRPMICSAQHTGSIQSVAFSPDGKIFTTTSADTTLILWDAATGAQISPPLTGHQASVGTAMFSPDGKWLASGSDDHSVILWNVGTCQRVARLTGNTDTVRALAFSREGKEGKELKLYSGSFESTVNRGDGGLQKWELDPIELEKKCHQRANRDLSTSEWNAYIRPIKNGLSVSGKE